jgi:hypothetical protein
MMKTILRGFVQKSGETRFSIAVTAKHKSKIETIGAIQYDEMTKLTDYKMRKFIMNLYSILHIMLMYPNTIAADL